MLPHLSKKNMNKFLTILKLTLFSLFLTKTQSTQAVEKTKTIPHKVLICGVCKNVEPQLPDTIQIVEKIGALFEDYQILIYENNSSDSTKQILKSWATKNPRVLALMENLTEEELASCIINRDESGAFSRPELIAKARNKVLDLAMSSKFKEFSYVIWMDLDFTIAPRYDGIVEVFESKQEWDAVFAYGVDREKKYWDWYAFRDITYPLGSEMLGNRWWYMNKSFHLSSEQSWYPVISAFGGFGIYKKASIEGCRYSGIVTSDLAVFYTRFMNQESVSKHPQVQLYHSLLRYLDSIIRISSATPNLPQIKQRTIGISLFDENCPIVWRMSSFWYQYPSVCEHVPFHASMHVNGHNKLYINPRLIFTYGDKK